ncbi:MAG TPA: lipoprotein [Caldimonas sp.]|jgi:predicted small lipoprotein YifL
MGKRAGSVVATAARALATMAFALLASCGQKGPLIGVKPVAPAAVPNLSPDPSFAAPETAPASAPR